MSSPTQKSTVIKRWQFATCRQVKRRKLLQPGRTSFFLFFQNNIRIAALKGATIQGSKSQRIKVRLCNINVIIIAHKHGSLHSINFFFLLFFVHTMCQQKRLLSSFLQPSSLSKCFIDIDELTAQSQLERSVWLTWRQSQSATRLSDSSFPLRRWVEDKLSPLEFFCLKLFLF